MLGLTILSLAVAYANAIVCLPNICATVRCAAVTAESCAGTIEPSGGFCGCCPLCVMTLAEGDSCFSSLLFGVPSNSKCGEGLYCDPTTTRCHKVAAKRQVDVIAHQQTCAQRLQAIQQGQLLLGQYIPRCESDGTYSAKQCHGSVCYCVDSKGTRIQGYSGSISDVNMDCKCARDLNDYMQSGLIGKLFSCTNDGSYQRYACTGSVCYCADSNGNMKLGSPQVNVGNIGSLQC